MEGGAADVIFEGQERKVKMRLEIVYLPPGDLTPYEKNTRKHSPDDIEQIKESIRQDGFSDPIGIWGEQNIIVEGHGRQIAALEMGLDEVPCIRLDHMTDEQRRDYAIRHNATGLLSEWDFSRLREEVAALEIEGHNFDGLRLELESMEMPADLDDEITTKTHVIVSMNFQNTDTYEAVKDELQRIADENGASMAVKMA